MLVIASPFDAELVGFSYTDLSVWLPSLTELWGCCHRGFYLVVSVIDLPEFWGVVS